MNRAQVTRRLRRRLGLRGVRVGEASGGLLEPGGGGGAAGLLCFLVVQTSARIISGHES